MANSDPAMPGALLCLLPVVFLAEMIKAWKLSVARDALGQSHARQAVARRLQTTGKGIDDRWSRDIAQSGNAGCVPEPARLELGMELGMEDVAAPGGWPGSPWDTKPGLPWHSGVRLQLIPAPALGPGLEEPDGATAPPPGAGWAHPGGGEQDALCPGTHIPPRPGHTPGVGLAREATKLGV